MFADLVKVHLLILQVGKRPGSLISSFLFPVLAADGARTNLALSSKDLGREESLGLKTLVPKGAFDIFTQPLLRDSLRI